MRNATSDRQVFEGVRQTSSGPFGLLPAQMVIARKRIWSIAVALALTCPLAALADQGRPVAASDLSGKTICWNDGWRITYAADGKYLLTRDNQPGHWPRWWWSIQWPGVVEIKEGYRQRYL